MTDEQLAATNDWLDTVCDTLGIDRAQLATLTPDLLDLAREVAHGPSRPATPLTLFALGLAVGSDPEGLTERTREGIAALLAQLL